jgi:hypothetical protein
MRPRFFPLSLVLVAALAGSSCLKSEINGPNGGLPPDTLPLSVADSALTFSIDRSALFVGETIQVFFTVRNNGTTNRVIQGSSSCTLNIKAYTLTGTVVSPAASRVCAADLVQYASLTPGETITMARNWTPSDQGSAPVALPAGVYELEPSVDASGFQRTGRRLRIQIVNR